MLTVNNIRPDALLGLMDEAKKHDLAWWTAQLTDFSPAICPLCGTRQEPQVHFQASSGLAYSQCTCGTLYQSRQGSGEVYGEYYRISKVMEVFSKHIFPGSLEKRRQNIYQPRLQAMLDLCQSHGSPKKLYVEVGAGSGVFAQMVQESGFFEHCLCVEPAPELAQDCRNNGLAVLEQTIEEVDMFPSSACTVAAFEVLEHLLNPKAFLQKLADIMPRGSCLFLATPNGQSMEVQELGAISTTLGWTHLQLFCPASLAKLLEACDFEVLLCDTPGLLDTDLLRRGLDKMQAQGQQSQSQKPWLHSFVQGADSRTLEDFQSFIASHGQSSHMRMVARKK